MLICNFFRSPPTVRRQTGQPSTIGHNNSLNSTLSPPQTGRSRSPTPHRKAYNNNIGVETNHVSFH